MKRGRFLRGFALNPFSMSSQSSIKKLEDGVAVVSATSSTENLYCPAVDTKDIDEKTLLRKIDLHIVPWLSLLYLFNFLDRGSIGNAKVRLCVFCSRLDDDNLIWPSVIWTRAGPAHCRPSVPDVSDGLLHWLRMLRGTFVPQPFNDHQLHLRHSRRVTSFCDASGPRYGSHA